MVDIHLYSMQFFDFNNGVHCTLRTPQSKSVSTCISHPLKNWKYTNTTYPILLFDTLWTQLIEKVRDGIFKLLRSPVIESKESIPPVRQPYSHSVPTPIDCSKIPAQKERKRSGPGGGWDGMEC